jgi:hypothetical protein
MSSFFHKRHHLITEPAALNPCSTCADVVAVEYSIGATKGLYRLLLNNYVAVMHNCAVNFRSHESLCDHNTG